MIIQEPGRVTERITFLGRRESCVYLLDGTDELAILGGGMASIIPDVTRQLEELGIDEHRIRRLIILHAHFDHVGIVPSFKKRWPWLTVTASQRAKDNLARPEVLQAIRDFSLLVLTQAGLAERAREFGLDDLKAFPIDEPVGEGVRLACGDRTLEIIATPGHSSCSIAVYIPEEQALAASDAGGIPFGGNVFAAANANFDQYQNSLAKMARYPVKVHMAEHYGAMTDEDARAFLPRSIESARQTRALLEESLTRTGAVDATVAEITELFASQAQGYFLPREVMQMVVGQMTRYLAKSIL